MCNGGIKKSQVRRASWTMVSVTLFALLVLVAAADCCYLFPSGMHNILSRFTLTSRYTTLCIQLH